MSEQQSEFGIAEALALRLFPDHHAFPMKIYVGDDKQLTAEGWKQAYNLMMSKPTDVTKEAWHAEKTNKER